jgi:uncharacterized protein YeeX (DUF496 family)
MRFVFQLLIILLTLASGLAARADEKIRPQSYKEFSDRSIQKHYFLPAATVAYANYQLLRQDFPKLTQLSDEEIDHWILDNFAYISESELQLRGLRISDFEVDMSKFKDWLQPGSYNRAAIAQAKLGEENIGLIDLKGSGHKQISIVRTLIQDFKKIMAIKNDIKRQSEFNKFKTRDHNDGVASLGEIFSEITRQMAVQESFDIYNAKMGTDFETVEAYFAIDAHFDILKPGEQIPAGIIGRQAHWRGNSALQAPLSIYRDDLGGFQASIFDSAVDFGGVILTETDLQKTFGDPQAYLIETNSGLKHDAQKSNAWIYAHETARDFRQAVKYNYHLARKMVINHIQMMLEPLQKTHEKTLHLAKTDLMIRYLVFRLNARTLETQRIAARELSKIPIREIESYFFKKNFPEQDPKEHDKMLALAAAALFSHPGLSKQSAFYEYLFSKSLNYLADDAQGERLQLAVLQEIESNPDQINLDYIARVLDSPSVAVRNKAREVFLTQDFAKILSAMPDILNQPFSPFNDNQYRIFESVLRDHRIDRYPQLRDDLIHRALTEPVLTSQIRVSQLAIERLSDKKRYESSPESRELAFQKLLSFLDLPGDRYIHIRRSAANALLRNWDFESLRPYLERFLKPSVSPLIDITMSTNELSPTRRARAILQAHLDRLKRIEDHPSFCHALFN